MSVHILMISDVYFPRVNGVSTSIMTFRREFIARGHRVTLIAPAYGGEPAEAGVIRIPSRYLFLDPEDRMMRGGAIDRIGQQLREAGVDLIHIQTPFVAHYAGLRLSRMLGVPTLETYHTFFEEYLFHYVPFLPSAWMRGVARRFSRTQCNAVDRVVVPSLAMAEALQRYGVITPRHVLPTGIELEDFAAGDGEAFRRRHGIAPQRPTLVYVGRVAHEKNIGFLLQVVARLREQLPQVLLVIAGEGPAVAALKRRVEALGIGESVLFVGYLARDGELQGCYRAGNAFVFASRTETQGLVLLEAMALGVPVVSTAVMGTRDVLRGGRGALVAEEDVEDFSAKVVSLLQDEALQQRLAAEARAYSREWSAGALAEQMLTLYGEVIAGEPVTAAAEGVSS